MAARRPSYRDGVDDDPRALLRRESRSLVQRLRLWTPTRFAAQAPSHGSRGDLVHHLAQRLADQASDAEGQPRRPLPRLEGDLVLPDQLAVTADDLARAADAETARRATSHLLLHRHALLEEDVPTGLVRALGLADVLAAGREECGRTA